MKTRIILLALVCIGFNAISQTDSTSEIYLPGDSSIYKTDTIRIGNILIIRGKNENGEQASIYRRKKIYTPTNISTNWGIIDLGFSQVSDKTNYMQSIAGGLLPGGANEDWFNQRNFKSTNIDIWIFMQRLNILKHVVNLKYGVGGEFNNYKYTENIRFQKTGMPLVIMDNISYRKNKLTANYITVPMLLNFNFTPWIKHGFGLSAGVSAGYLYASKQKINDGPEPGKVKYRDDFDLRKFKLAYIAELNLGPILLYASVGTQSMFEKALDQTPVNFGIRLSSL